METITNNDKIMYDSETEKCMPEELTISTSGLPPGERERQRNIAICRTKLLGAINYHRQQLRLIEELGEQYVGHSKAHHRRKIKGCEFGIAVFFAMAQDKEPDLAESAE